MKATFGEEHFEFENTNDFEDKFKEVALKKISSWFFHDVWDLFGYLVLISIFKNQTKTLRFENYLLTIYCD